jgi:hypothetical protein
MSPFREEVKVLGHRIDGTGVSADAERVEADPYGRILVFLDRTCCVNPIDNTHYAPITTTPSTRTKYFTRTLVRSTSLVHSHKALQ